MLISAISHSLGIHSAGFLAEEVDSDDENDDVNIDEQQQQQPSASSPATSATAAASCWCLAGTRVSMLSVLTLWPLFQMAVLCVVHLLTWLCVCIFDVYLANYRKTLLELD